MKHKNSVSLCINVKQFSWLFLFRLNVFARIISFVNPNGRGTRHPNFKWHCGKIKFREKGYDDYNQINPNVKVQVPLRLKLSRTCAHHSTHDAVTPAILLWKQLLHSVDVQVFSCVPSSNAPEKHWFSSHRFKWCGQTLKCDGHFAETSENEKLNLIMFLFGDICMSDVHWATDIYGISFTLFLIKMTIPLLVYGWNDDFDATDKTIVYFIPLIRNSHLYPPPHDDSSTWKKGRILNKRQQIWNFCTNKPIVEKLELCVSWHF